jgi:ribonuclease HI
LSVELWTDGSGTTEGPIGWAYVLRHVDSAGKISDLLNGGKAPVGTNNVAELMAVLEGLRALKRPGVALTVVTDSEYVMKGFTEGRVAKWKRNGWRTSAGKQVANQEIWLELEAEVIKHRVSWRHVRGHAGHELNELVDQVAGIMRRQAIAEAPAVTDPLFNESGPPSDELDGPELQTILAGSTAGGER